MPASTLRPGLVLALAILAVSWGSILVRFCDSPPLFIAFYRLAFSAAILFPAVAWQGRSAVPVPWRNLALQVLASGLLLALHFGAWISSLAWTTVASSVVLVSTVPIFAALLSSRILAERAPARLYVGVAISLVGTLLIGGGNYSLSPSRLVGDLLALLGAAALAGHLVVGRSLRKEISLSGYLFFTYGSGAVILGIILLSWQKSVLVSRQIDYLWFLLMALVPSLIGHSSLNWAVRRLKVFHVSLAAFGEPILASWYAYLLFEETISRSQWIGSAFIFAGILAAVPRPEKSPSTQGRAGNLPTPGGG